MPNPASARAGFALAALSAAAFGVLPIFGKLAFAEGFEVGDLLAWRFGLGALTLWGLVLAGVAAPGARQPIPASRRPRLVALGAFYAGNSALYFLALRRIPATTTSLIFYVYPAIVAVLGILWLKQPARALQLAVLGTALLGVLLTIGFARGPLDPPGVAFALTSAVVVAVYLVLGEVALVDLPTLRATAYVMTGTAVTFLLWEVATGGPELPPSPRAWALVAVMATVSTALSVLAMLAAVSRIGAGVTAIVSTLEPAVTAALAALTLGERLAPTQLAGGALILSAVLLLRLGARRRPPLLAEP